jgi:CrcB protein
MLNLVVLVFVGGAVGATVREYIMLATPHLADGFPLDILVANIVAAFLLGLVTALHRRGSVSDGVNTMVGTGVMGGLSTFSSFVYGSFVLMTASLSGAAVAATYVVISVVVGYLAVIIGLRYGRPPA